MSTKGYTTLFVGVFVAFCVAMVIDARHKGGLAQAEQQPAAAVSAATSATTAATPATPASVTAEKPAPVMAPAQAVPDFKAVVSAKPSTVTLGSSDPTSKYMFEIKLSSKGASIDRVTLSQFKDRFDKKKQLDLLLPLKLTDGSEVLSMTTESLAMLDQKVALPLGQVDWFAGQPETGEKDEQSVTFTAAVKLGDSGEVLQIAKKYTVKPGQYDIGCDVTVKNLSGMAYKTRFDMDGPAGIAFEGNVARASSMPALSMVAAYISPKNEVVTTRSQVRNTKDNQEMTPKDNRDQFIWASVTDRYFAAIVVPMPEEGETPGWILKLTGKNYTADATIHPEGALGFVMRTNVLELAPAGQAGSEKTCRFEVFLGPKDKSLFDSVPLYEKLGFKQTIDFMACCCPAALIGPIAFGILALMKATYAFIPNYGVIIILLVLLVRLILHPITKKSQVSMMKMGKLGPKAEEIKKQYADNKEEMNKRLMGLYKEAGVSPLMGMLPMILQMPIWIALYGAIYASIDLRGAAFLPFWITDLSAPDAVLSWTPIAIPLIGSFSSLNILPILLAIGMYLQQKLTPQTTMQSADSAMAQQQKIMLVMMPAMMLLFLYNAPSGLNLYIMASTFGGVIEQKVIKKHIEEREAEEAMGLVSVTSKTGGKIKKKKPKPFFKY
jgi:YidC/Oxa1 family membrane protein insertase